MVPIGTGSPIEAVPIRHEESAVTVQLSTVTVTIPTGTGPTEPQHPSSFRGQSISIIQDGGLSLSISASFYASKKTFKLLSLLSGWGRWVNGLLLLVRRDR